jgi:hypothetical protein
MAFNNTALNVAGDAMAAAYPFISIHTSGTVADSTNESTAARVAAAWSAATNGGDITAGPLAFTGGAASGPAIRVGYWSAASGGTYGGGSLLSGDQAFNAAGDYTVTSITETGSAT